MSPGLRGRQNRREIGWDQECSAVARYDIVLNLPTCMSDTGAYYIKYASALGSLVIVE